MLPADRIAPPLGAVLVRVPAAGPDWIDRLPPVPSGHTVTVSVSDTELRRVPSERLFATGYRVVGVHDRRSVLDGAAVDLLVTAELADEAPAWWHALLALADRAFDLRLGPVQRVLGQEIALHLGQA